MKELMTEIIGKDVRAARKFLSNINEVAPGQQLILTMGIGVELLAWILATHPKILNEFLEGFESGNIPLENDQWKPQDTH